MQMIEIAMVVCLISSGVGSNTAGTLDARGCRDVSLVIAGGEDVTLVQCQMGAVAMAHVQKWLESHPNRYVKRWRCQMAGSIAGI